MNKINKVEQTHLFWNKKLFNYKLNINQFKNKIK